MVFNILILVSIYVLNDSYGKAKSLNVEYIVFCILMVDDLSGYLLSGSIRRWSFKPIVIESFNEREVHLGMWFVVLFGFMTFNLIKTMY